MLVHISGAKCIGIDALEVVVEIKVDKGIGIHLVGLADVAVKESLLRTTTALASMGFHIPGKRIVINLAPADLHKNGSGYDLAIALGIISGSGQKDLPLLERYLIMGELGLNGEIREVPGALSFVELARSLGLKGCILPLRSALEAVDFDDIEVYGILDLGEAITILSGTEDCSDMLVQNRRPHHGYGSESPGRTEVDMCDIIGQEGAKRGIEIAAAGGHNIIMIGAPGSGKSSLAKALAGILPPMTREESIVTSKIYSVSGRGGSDGLIRTRPYRAPHYSASMAALVGGGAGGAILPGEVSLAHCGVLFLDEFGQMPRSVIEALRGPIEDRKVVISRLRSKVEFPSSFMLVVASNPCPCGYWGEGDRCTCTPAQRIGYLSKLSGPILDRIDLQLVLHPVPSDKIASGVKGEDSATVAARVAAARKLQQERFRGEGINCNSEMGSSHIERFCPLDDTCRQVLLELMERLGLSMRAYFRIIKVARTIADLEGSPSILPVHIAEASSFRFLDRKNPLV